MAPRHGLPLVVPRSLLLSFSRFLLLLASPLLFSSSFLPPPALTHIFCLLALCSFSSPCLPFDFTDFLPPIHLLFINFSSSSACSPFPQLNILFSIAPSLFIVWLFFFHPPLLSTLHVPSSQANFFLDGAAPDHQSAAFLTEVFVSSTPLNKYQVVQLTLRFPVLYKCLCVNDKQKGNSVIATGDMLKIIMTEVIIYFAKF